jgi:hypothetical protein
VWRTAACLSLLAVASTGCGVAGLEGAECSGGEVHGGQCVPYTAADKVALILGGMPVPPRNSRPLANIKCSVRGSVADCQGFDATGRLIRAKFRIVSPDGRPESLAPICPSAKHPDRATSVFCTQ